MKAKWKDFVGITKSADAAYDAYYSMTPEDIEAVIRGFEKEYGSIDRMVQPDAKTRYYRRFWALHLHETAKKAAQKEKNEAQAAARAAEERKAAAEEAERRRLAAARAAEKRKAAVEEAARQRRATADEVARWRRFAAQDEASAGSMSAAGTSSGSPPVTSTADREWNEALKGLSRATGNSYVNGGRVVSSSGGIFNRNRKP